MDIRPTKECDLDLDIELMQHKDRFLRNSVSLTFMDKKKPLFITSLFLDDNTIGFTKLTDLNDSQSLGIIYAMKSILRRNLGDRTLYAFIKPENTHSLKLAKFFKFFEIGTTDGYIQLMRKPQCQYQ